MSIVVHVEASQLARFERKLLAFDAVYDVQCKEPLLFVKFAPNAQEELIRLCFQGRIAAQRVYQVNASCSDAGWIAWSQEMNKDKENRVFKVMAYPNHLQQKLVEMIAHEGFRVHPKDYTHELHVVYAAPLFLFGVIERNGEFGHVDEILNVPCRAYHKLAEALADCVPFKDGYHALDIGASPGGWTEFLAKNGAHVVAVDPGEITVHVENIIHLPMLLEQAFDHLKTMKKFDLCVCDINIRPHKMAQLIASVAPFLHPNATVVLTFKLSRRPTQTAVDEAFNSVCKTLSKGFHEFKLTWLHANTINERTLFAKKKAFV
ncbi:ribosomal RNA large subunit methyltransferase J [Thraustotheca clavata]|uniref:Ribosomal RNA large subunit methyltransferase J n=1 Tax=Thraustotheca clavata TaxID=74557 RepID=A0A1V9ZWL8_9STRA|nr:ribosomal RNA large subunit methyltransferase J [Thraustotheca clavata]